MVTTAETAKLDSLCRDLERRWHDEIPISEAMGIAVRRFDGRTLEVSKALAPNVNVHGSAFAGSQFSVASLCGWGQVHLQLALRRLTGSIVFVEGTIRCLKPVRADALVRCCWDDDAATALDRLAESRQARILLNATLESSGIVGAEFRGEYAVRLPGSGTQ